MVNMYELLIHRAFLTCLSYCHLPAAGFYMHYDDFGGKVPLYVHICLMMIRIDSACGTVTSIFCPTSLVPKVVRCYTLHLSGHWVEQHCVQSYPNPTALKLIPDRRGSHCTRACDFEHRRCLTASGIHNIT